MSTEIKERPKIGVGVIVMKEGKILMGKRKNAHGEGSWSFPGGHLEFNESVEDCARRETEEEIGVKIKNIRLGPYTQDVFKKEKKHYLTHFVLCEIKFGEPKVCEPEKCEKWEWKSWKKLPKPLFLPIQNLIKQKFNPFS